MLYQGKESGPVPDTFTIDKLMACTTCGYITNTQMDEGKCPGCKQDLVPFTEDCGIIGTRTVFADPKDPKSTEVLPIPFKELTFVFHVLDLAAKMDIDMMTEDGKNSSLPRLLILAYHFVVKYTLPHPLQRQLASIAAIADVAGTRAVNLALKDKSAN